MIDAVGNAVDRSRIGQRIWVYLAQSYRPFGTAAEYTVVPARHAVPLPASVAFEQAAGLGIPAITAHRAIFADGPVAGQNVVVTGAVGAVGRAALAVARRGGASVIATVRRPTQIEAALAAGADDVIDTAAGGVTERIVAFTGEDGVDRVAEVAFAANSRPTSRSSARAA